MQCTTVGAAMLHDAQEAREGCLREVAGRSGRPIELVLEDHQLVMEVQRLWHRRGFNGCVFSQAVAARADHLGWHQVVLGQDIVGLTSCRGGIAIEEAIDGAVADPSVRNLSLLFPRITRSRELALLMQAFTGGFVPSLFLQHQEQEGDMTALSLRTTTIPHQQLGWIMGFGPFDFLPNSRQAPVTELVIPVKPKPQDLYHKHSHDHAAAHVADIPTNLSDKTMDRLWDATYLRTRHILGGEPDLFSAARTTFSVPSALWHSLGHR